MNSCTIALFSGLSLLSACRSERTSEAIVTDSVPALEIQKHAELAVDENEPEEQSALPLSDSSTARFINTEIAGEPFIGDLETILRDAGDHKIQKELYENPHIQGQIDTVLHISFDESHIAYFKGASDAFIVSAEIRSRNVSFKRGIRVGMRKSDFFALFDELRDRSEDSVLISDIDDLQSVAFLFADGILKEVKFEGYFD